MNPWSQVQEQSDSEAPFSEVPFSEKPLEAGASTGSGDDTSSGVDQTDTASSNPWASASDSTDATDAAVAEQGSAAASNPWAGSAQTQSAPDAAQSDSFVANDSVVAGDPVVENDPVAADDWLAQAEPEAAFNWMSPFEEPLIPLAEWVEWMLAWVVEHFRPVFQAIRWPVDATLTGFEEALLAVPSPLMLVLLAVLSWQFAGRKMGVFTFGSLLLVGLIGVWSELMVTLALVLTSVSFCLLVGIPLGIALSRSDRLVKVVRPMLDAMQTTPAFVYLVPVVMLFGIGNVPGVVVTIIFALPPVVRLTNLGIRQVPEDLVEAAHAFGCNKRQLLWRVQFPLALPTIMAGVNQTLMMALSMVVIASMIAVGGLGQMVLRGIGRLDMGLATVGGVGIVVLAILLDRLTHTIAQNSQADGEQRIAWYERGPIGWVRTLLVNKTSVQ